jgi:hypothetical protein
MKNNENVYVLIQDRQVDFNWKFKVEVFKDLEKAKQCMKEIVAESEIFWRNHFDLEGEYEMVVEDDMHIIFYENDSELSSGRESIIIYQKELK